MLDKEITDVEIKEPVKRKRRTKAEMEVVKAEVEVADLVQLVGSEPHALVNSVLQAAGLLKHVAEVITTEDVGIRVEFRAHQGTVFRVQGQGDMFWVTYTGKLEGFPEFLSKITPVVTIST